ncbi:MAG: ddpX [Gemmatimonadetes bacterium]|nr:ddpX [Gemmatimonadota bacterium]
MENLHKMRASALALVLVLAAACGSNVPAQATTPRASEPPVAPPERWLALIGEYGPEADSAMVLERDGRLVLHMRKFADVTLAEQSADVFSAGEKSRVRFLRNTAGRVTSLIADGTQLVRRQVGPESGNQLLVPPVRPMAELRKEALAASPPVEAGPFRPTDLVELTTLDPTIKLEIRYATSNNLFGTPFYSEARAFLQRPAAEAVVRANKALRAQGYGLLIHDGYRPWYVTKMFWDASPKDKHIFVADPSKGSRHNRGAAVDLTLYDLGTGAPVEMVSTYDETSSRAYPDYPGGTSRQRWYRALLRTAMEAERFTVFEAEWWHFDYADWKQYGIGNVDFGRIGR